jgi:DNA-directed RNA polymerase sigma subunit (sigma70/sigma32)
MTIVEKIQNEIMIAELSFGEIAEKFNMPYADVNLIAEKMMEQDSYDESMDGDFDSAMASAGFGTDEDYGYYGDE